MNLSWRQAWSPVVFVDDASVNTFDKFIGVCNTGGDGLHCLSVTLSCNLGDIVAQAETTTLQGCIKFIGIVSEILLKVKDTAVELTHVLDYWLRYKAPFNEILKQTLRYPLCIPDIALASGSCLMKYGFTNFSSIDSQSSFHTGTQ